MVFLRSLIYFILMVATTILYSILLFSIGFILPFAISSRIANSWGWVNLQLLKWICGLDYRLHGTEHIPEGSCIILSKHQSAWETIAFRHLLPPLQTWVLKRELMRIPLFGWALAAMQPIAIDRKAGKKAAKQIIEKGIHFLQQGRNVIIFPEGTRVTPGQRKKYGVGGALLAKRSGHPVLPVAHNAGVFWRRRALEKYPGTIHVVFGPVIETDGLTAAAINRQVEEWIESTVERLPRTTQEVYQEP
ncbi:MAG: 1-acyl-sn-glycerol-3-phosphate acyltransferase [Chloroflexi bacterium]|nr:MAG: 1-acyl-sn-glycerol-3-phosphate acyltransferase [Chloroflexota bacterium]